MPINQPADGSTNWGPEVRAAIAAVNTLEGVTAANLPETIRDTIGSTVVGSGLVTVTPNDALDTVTVATSATANASDAQLRDRSTHTGTQTAATVSDLTEAIQDVVAAFIVAGTNVTATYNDVAGTLTLEATGGAGGGGGGLDAESVRDTIGAALLGSGLVSVTVNDTADTITISTAATANSSDATLLNRANHTGTQLAATISDLGEAVDDRVGALLVPGPNVTLTYNDTANTLTVEAGGGGGLNTEAVQDIIGATVLGSGLITATYDDAANTHTITTAATANSGDATLLNRANHTGTQLAATISDFAETARDTVAAALVAGANVTITYNDAADTITISATGGGGSTSTDRLYTRGINVSGGEFAAAAATLPGVYNTDYSYDTAAAFTNLAARGHDLVRLPFRWERIQPTRNAALNSAELGRLQTVVSDISAAGMTCVLDVHNYARYINSTGNGGATLVLGDTLPTADLVDLWTRLSTAFKGNAGVYAYGLMNEPHDLLPVSGSFTGTTRYDWNAGTVAGWTGDSATASNVASRLRLSASVGSGTVLFRKDDAAAVAGGSTPTGNVLRFEATLVTNPGGTWTAKAQWQNSSFSWQNPTSVVYTRVDTGATVTGLIQNVAVRVTCTFSSITSPPTAFAVQIDGSGVTAGTATVDIDNFAQGSLSGSQTAAQVWEGVTQQLVTAIRNNGDTTKILVPGYGHSGAQTWTTNHSTPWITDPANNVAYEAHYYFDIDNSGDYPDSYTTENAAAVSAGFASLTARATTQLNVWLNWLNTYNVDGFFGEFGWPNTADTTSWNAVGEALYDLLDAAFVDATYWATGARWGTTYNLSAYTGTTLSTVKAQASVIEAHPSAELNTASEIADLATRVGALEADATPTHAPPHLGPAFMVIGASTSSDLATSAANGSTHGLVEVKWDQCQTTAGGAVDASATITNINNIIAAGMKVCLRVSPQYPPSFVQSGVPAFRRQGSVDYTATQASGNNVRDWVWSATGRNYLQDFLTKLFAQLDWSKIERVQLGGLVAGELAYPVNDGVTPYWWGFSTPAQTGTGIAPRMAPCPVPGTVPSSGTTWTDNDEIFVAWYMQSLINFMVWLVEQHRKWFSGPIWVLHPSSGLRKVSQTPTGASALNYRLEASRGTDWEWQVGAYPDPDVHPYCTWADAQHFWTAAPYSDVNDANAAPWYHLLRVARRAGRSARIWGENTVVESSNTVMNRVFKDGAVAFGYEGFTWLNHTSLATASNDTYANWAARIAEVDVDGGTSAYPSGGAGGGGLSTEAVQDTIGSTVVAGPGVAVAFNDTAGTLTVSSPGPPQTIAYASAITPNAAAGNLFRCTATGNLTLNDPTGGVDGQAVTVEILASGGDRALSFAGGGTGVTIPAGQWWTGTLRLNNTTWLLDDAGAGGGGGGGSSLPVIVGGSSLVDGTNRAVDLQTLFDSVPSTGARVMLPAGWIRTQSTVQITKDNTVVQGAGLSVRDGSSQGGIGTRIGPNPGDTFSGTDILLVQRTANDRPVHGVVLQDFGVEGSNVAGTVGIHFRSNRSRIDRVSVIQCGSHGVRLHGYTAPAWDLYDSTIQGLFSDCGGTGVWFDDGATDMHILPGTVIFNNSKGIHFTGGGSAQITGVHTYDNATNNIHFAGAGSRTKISNCKIEGAGQHGVLIDSTVQGYSDIQITGCNLANNGDSASNTYDQIHTLGPSANGITRLTIVGNNLTNKSANLNLPRYGININSTALQTATIVGNSFGPASHWGTGPLRDAGSGSSVRQIRHNGGYITEASGTATVASGATTTTVTHGLSTTPTAAHVNVTPTNSLGNATKFWVSTVGATTFVINVNSDPGATTATFAWKAEVV